MRMHIHFGNVAMEKTKELKGLKTGVNLYYAWSTGFSDYVMVEKGE